VVSGAVVSFAWSGGYAGTGTCTTAAAGTCSASTGNMKNTKTSVTFDVTNLAKSGATYDPGANQDPDGDSNGTRITVTR
jgi:hypothetical protein